MNRLHLVGIFLINIPIFSQVGINTSLPTKMIDINGEARIRTLPTGTTSDNVIVADAEGNIRKVSRNDFAGNTNGGGDEDFSVSILGYVPQPIANKIVPATAPGGANVTELGCKQYSVNNHYYCAYSLSTGTNWFNTFSLAKQLGGYLVTLTNDAETTWVYSQIMDSYNISTNVWIGYNKISEPGNSTRFRWITGEEFKVNWSTNPSTTENRFNTGEPNNAGGNEGSTHIIGAGGTCNRLWNDSNGTLTTSSPSCGVASANQTFSRVIVEFNN